MRHHPASPHAPDRLLLVADWSVDPKAVVDVARQQRAADGVALLVPAKLNGIDWAGDPYASVPCAQRQLDRITELADQAGLRLAGARVGDPEPLAAICDALADWPADELLLCVPRRRLTPPYPFDLRTRACRLTGLAIERLELPVAARASRRRGARWLRRGHCAIETPQVGLTFAAPR